MTQRELIKRYISHYGYIVPARVGGTEFMGFWLGSETSKRCREMRKEGILVSQPWDKDPKFEEFTFKGQATFDFSPKTVSDERNQSYADLITENNYSTI